MKHWKNKMICKAIYCCEVIICIWILLSSIKLIIEYVDILRLPNGWIKYVEYLMGKLPATIKTSRDVTFYALTEVVTYVFSIVFSILVIVSRGSRFLKTVMLFDIIYAVLFVLYSYVIGYYQYNVDTHFPFSVVIGCVIHFLLSNYRRKALNNGVSGDGSQ